jgi:hypothetical protein
MRLRIRAEQRELRASCRLVHDNAVDVADSADLTQLGNTVTILVDADVPLAVMHQRIALGGVTAPVKSCSEAAGVAHVALGHRATGVLPKSSSRVPGG